MTNRFYVSTMNKTIVVTGATKGIGKALVQKFASEGWNVAFCARNDSDIERLKSEIGNQKSESLGVRCDVTKRSELKGFADAVREKFVSIDILVNNAGVFLPGKVISEPEGTLEKLMETNLYSAYHLTRHLLPSMLEKKHGHIFNMCSVASIKAYPNGGSYSISKFALLGFSKALREELKPYHIKVTALVAGATLTDSWKGTVLPESRFMKPEDVAQSVWDIAHLSENTVVEEVLLRPVLGDI